MNKLSILLILGAVLLVVGSSLASSIQKNHKNDNEWMSYKKTHSKQYKSESEESMRYQRWVEVNKMVNDHNEKFKQGLTKYTMKVNHLADRTKSELKARLTPLKRGEIESTPVEIHQQSPSSIDWRSTSKCPLAGGNCVSPVKSQGECGSCWAFAATAALESHLMIYKSKKINLSEQQLVDCVYNYDGCEGGQESDALNYVSRNGITTTSIYPYISAESATCGTCKYRSATKITDFKTVTVTRYTDENAAKNAIGSIGPGTFGIYISAESFSYYEDGIYEEDCGEDGGHAMALVGYGIEDGYEFWLVKNSWGADWGNRGYMKIPRNYDYCSITDGIVVPRLNF